MSSLFFLLPTPALSAQEPAAPRSAATTAAAAEPQAAGQIVSSPPQVVPALPVPRLIKFSGVAKDASGQRRSGTVGITFSIYAEQQGGATLWMETQNAALDAQGRYAVLLGSTQSAGLPLDLFATGEPRWLGVKLELPGEVEQPRVLLVSVPYALKASDADTVGGMPASAFVLAPTGSGSGAGASTPGSTKSTAAKSKAEPLFTSSGTANYIPIFTDSTGDMGNSNIYQTSNPGNYVIKAPTGGAVLNASNFSDQDMQVVLTAPGASDKHAYFGPSTPTNLTLGTGGVEKMRITNAGNVGIGYSNPQQRLVIGAPAGGTVLNATNLADQDLNVIVSAPGASDKHTYFGPSTNTNLTLGVGGLEKVRITNAGHVGIGTTAPAYPLDVNGIINSSAGFGIGSNLFAFGSYANYNAFLGFAGNATMTGQYNTASGSQALFLNTTGNYNTASGYRVLYSNATGTGNTASGFDALFYNTTGSYNTADGKGALVYNTTGWGNTASGWAALQNNTTGSYNTASGLGALVSNTTGCCNTASGWGALQSNTTGSYNTALGNYADVWPGDLTNATAIGAYALVTTSNALVLGSINNVQGATADTFVGIGTTAPTYKLHVGTINNGLRVEGPATGGSGAVSASFGGNGDFAIDAPGIAAGRLVVKDTTGYVGIGTASPDNALSVNGSADKPGGGSWGTYSDGRLKTLNGSFSSGLSQILKLNPVRYRYKPGNAMGIRDAEEHIGVVAQEVQRVIPEAVTENSKGYLLVNNDPIIWTMLNAIKEQQGEFRQEQAELARALRQIKQQRNLLRAQTSAMRSLEAEVRETRETVRKVKAQVAAVQPALVAAK